MGLDCRVVFYKNTSVSGFPSIFTGPLSVQRLKLLRGRVPLNSPKQLTPSFF